MAGRIQPSELSNPNSWTASMVARTTFWARFVIMARIGIAMMFHDRLKLLGVLLGVVFAIVLTNQSLAVFLGLLHRNTMLVDNAGADIWIVPPGTENLGYGRTISLTALYGARTIPGVDWAEPLIYGSTSIKAPNGGTNSVTLIGTKYPRYAGGPWNLVAGDRSALNRPDTLTLEDSERETLGGVNLGSVREVGGRKMTVGAFTWGLEPFGPSYAFADFETVRELTHTPSDQASYVLVGAAQGQDLSALKARLAAQIPNARVMDARDFRRAILHYVIFSQSLGTSFGTSTVFALVVGFVIVALSMFSSVVDNIREFGTLKAVGMTNGDLTILLLVQSVLFAWIGSLAGLAIVTRLVNGMRSAKLTVVLPAWMVLGSFAAMTLICMAASCLALFRIRKLEPAMVFR